VLGVVFELFVLKKHLFARREDELGAAISALENSIVEFHVRPASLDRESPKSANKKLAAGPGSLPSFTFLKGPGPLKRTAA
jgi:hypothetical protein